MALIPVMLLFLYLPGFWTKVCGALLFALAALTDLVDGRIARARGEVTDFGAVMDPLADKVLVLAVFAVLVERGVVPAYLMILVMAREIAISGIRIVAASKGRVIAASTAGKTKTAWQIAAVSFGLLSLILAEAANPSGFLGDAGWTLLRYQIPWAVSALAAFLSLSSGLAYFKAAWPLLDPSAK